MGNIFHLHQNVLVKVISLGKALQLSKCLTLPISSPLEQTWVPKEMWRNARAPCQYIGFLSRLGGGGGLKTPRDASSLGDWVYAARA